MPGIKPRKRSARKRSFQRATAPRGKLTRQGTQGTQRSSLVSNPPADSKMVPRKQNRLQPADLWQSCRQTALAPQCGPPFCADSSQGPKRLSGAPQTKPLSPFYPTLSTLPDYVGEWSASADLAGRVQTASGKASANRPT